MIWRYRCQGDGQQAPAAMRKQSVCRLFRIGFQGLGSAPIVTEHSGSSLPLVVGIQDPDQHACMLRCVELAAPQQGLQDGSRLVQGSCQGLQGT